MKKISGVLLAVLFGLASSLHAASPSSVTAQGGVKPSTVRSNGGFNFKARDQGKHLGWCKGQGHSAPPGNMASGHRNHGDCDNGSGDGGGDGGVDPIACTEFEIFHEGQCIPLG